MQAQVSVDAGDGKPRATPTDGSGWFAFAGLPTERELVVRATVARRTATVARVTLSRLARGPEPLRLTLFDADNVTGSVVYAMGTPLAGACVLAVSVARGIGAEPSEASTGRDGRFVLERVPLGPIAVRVWTPGHAFSEQRLFSRRDVELRFVLAETEKRRITVEVGRLPDADARAGTRVRLRWVDASGFEQVLPRALSQVRVDEQGKCTLLDLPTGRYGVRVEHDTIAFTPRTMALDLSQPIAGGVRFWAVLPEPVSVSGTLRQRDGTPLPGRTLELRTPSGGKPAQITTDAEGRFATRAPLPAHETAIVRLLEDDLVLAGDRDPNTELETVIRPQMTLALIARSTGVVRGRVVDALGNPVGHAELALSLPGYPHGSGRRSRFRRAYTTPEGAFTFAGVPLEYRDLELAVEAFDLRGYAITDRLDVGGGASGATCELRLAPAAEIRGIVRDGDGTPLPGAWLMLRMVSAGGGFAGQEHWSTLADRAGRFVIAGLEPRAYGLRVLTAAETPAGPRKLLELEAGKPAEVELVVR